jgi:hypothetical protein
MKIPVWLSAVLVAAALGGAGAYFESGRTELRSELKAMQTDITTLKVDVAVIKARTEPPAKTVAQNP